MDDSEDPNEVFTMTISKLMAEAEKDGTITEEELEIIKQVEVDADSFNMILQAAMDDGVITEEETQQLEEMKATIMERAEVIASLDGVIDEDEEAMIQKLSEILRHNYRTE